MDAREMVNEIFDSGYDQGWRHAEAFLRAAGLDSAADKLQEAHERLRKEAPRAR